MFIKTIPCLDLEQIALSGQCFRMNPHQEEDGTYQIVCQGYCLKVFQTADQIHFDCPESDLEYWLTYFDYATDYAAVMAAIDPRDSYLKTAASMGSGIRILRQDPWEMIITFIISQQKTIPKIKEAVEALSAGYGTPIEQKDQTLYAFPTPHQLANATLEDLQQLKLGYRAKYIYQLCKDCMEGRFCLEHLKSLDYDGAMDYLTQFYGIGVKVANCVCLFGLHHIDAFPVDTWIQKILLKYYDSPVYHTLPMTKRYHAMVNDHFGRYKGSGGIMQQYIFHYERNILPQLTNMSINPLSL